MGTHPIFESDFDCLTDNEMGDTNLSLADILTELIESEEVIGCGFGDKNGLTLAVEGDISINDIAEGVAYASHCTPEESNVTIEEYLPNVSLISTYITEDLYLIRLHDGQSNIHNCAHPGRLNQVHFIGQRPGVFYGQCSEICGANHRFIPIRVELVNIKEFTSWLVSVLQLNR